MTEFVEELKKFACSTGAGQASYTLTYEDGSTLVVTYKPNKRR